MTDTGPSLLDEPVVFWENRHAALDPWRSGGDLGLSVEENFEFYAIRFGRLAELIRAHAGAERPLRILDAGCGRGHITDMLRRCGHDVTGLDASATAIAKAREAYGDGFVVGELDSLRPPRLFDVVICLDVLFHILDDAVWRRSVAAFARYASAEALVILTDAFDEQRYNKGDYIVHRSASENDEAMAAAGFARVELVPYRFGHNPNAIAAYRRRL